MQAYSIAVLSEKISQKQKNTQDNTETIKETVVINVPTVKNSV